MQKAVAIADTRSKIDPVYWYVPLNTPSIQQQDILSQQILSRTITGLRYVKRSVFMKELNNQNL